MNAKNKIISHFKKKKALVTCKKKERMYFNLCQTVRTWAILRGSSPGRSGGGREKEGELELHLQFLRGSPLRRYSNSRDVERLPFVWKTRKLRAEFKWNDSSRQKFSAKKINTFQGITFCPFLPKRPKFSAPYVWITSARLHVERKRKIYRYFVNGTTQSRSCFRCQKIPVPFDGNFSPKFVASSPSFSRPAPRAPHRACLQAKHRHVECARAILNALV